MLSRNRITAPCLKLAQLLAEIAKDAPNRYQQLIGAAVKRDNNIFLQITIISDLAD